MKKFLSIVLSVLMILSTVIIGAGAIEENQTKAISMTVYDLETGEETVETYEIDTQTLANMSSISNSNTLSVSSLPEQTLDLLSGDSEFTNIGLSKVSNTTVRPFSAIGLFKIVKELSILEGYGTAFMVSDKVAVTAAHNLYNKKKDKWYRGGYFYPGKNGAGIGNEPYGMCYAKKWAVCTQYIENTDSKLDSQYDWGAFVLDKPIGKECGKLTLSPLSYDEISNANLLTAGYPQYEDDIGTIVNYCQYKQQMRSDSIDPNTFAAPVNCRKGQSGSPVIANNVVCGILSSRGLNGEYTRYTRINETAYSYLMQFVADNA